MLPPIVRRFFSSSPIAAPVLLILAITMLFLGTNPNTRARIVPGSWLGGSGVGGPVGVGRVKEEVLNADQEELLKVYDHGAPAVDPKVVVAPPPNDDDDRLPAEYAAHFKNRVLPDSLDTVPALATRLASFLRRPIRSFNESRDANELHCSRSIADNLIQADFWKDNHEFWENDVTREEVTARRAEIVKYLAKKVWEGEEVLGKEGTKGIVLTAGNKDTTERCASVIRALKSLEVDLPIEVFHYPGELTDYKQRQTILDTGAKIVEVKNVQRSTGEWKNWQIKAYALIQSSFSDILYLDSDNLPLRDPTHLFSAPLFLNNGRAAFWPDFTKEHPSNPIWRIVGQQCTQNEWTFESGQIVFSKAGNGGLNLAALQIAASMMDDDVRDFWFRLSQGDKDTFRWAFRILDIAYATAPRWMSSLGFLEQDGKTFCGHTILQYDLVTPQNVSAPPPLFAHSNLLKHLGGWGFGGESSSLFSYVKRMVNDEASDPSLNKAVMYVRHGPPRNMCVDLKNEEDKEATGGDGVNRVILEKVDDLEGHPFERFDKMFTDIGGKVGGW